MESVDFLDKYLDPPDEPEWGQCDGCGEDHLYDDMYRIGRQWICEECRRQEEINRETVGVTK